MEMTLLGSTTVKTLAASICSNSIRNPKRITEREG
jgi:hypothetical protein